MELLAKKEISEPEVVSFQETANPFPALYNRRSSRIRSLLLFMVSLTPLDTGTGEPVDINTIMSTGHVGRIFSRAEKTVTSSPANRIFLKDKEDRKIIDQLLFIDSDKLEPVLKSHAIPEKAYEALKKNNPSEFIKQRKEYLKQLEYEFIQNLGITVPDISETTVVETDTD